MVRFLFFTLKIFMKDRPKVYVYVDIFQVSSRNLPKLADSSRQKLFAIILQDLQLKMIKLIKIATRILNGFFLDCILRYSTIGLDEFARKKERL